MRRPIGLTPGQYFFAIVSLMTMTGSVSARSASVNRRPAAQRRAERLEVAGRDDLPVGGEAGCSPRRTSLDADAPVAARARERQAGDGARRLHAGRFAQPPADVAIRAHHRARRLRSVASGSDVRSVSTCAGLKPASTSSRRAKLRASSIAAATSTTDAAISPTTSARRSQPVPTCESRPPSFNTGCRSARDDCSAGTMPKRMPVTTASAAVNASTRPSIAMSCTRGIFSGSSAISAAGQAVGERDAGGAAEPPTAPALR